MELMLKEKRKYGNLEIHGYSRSDNIGTVIFIHGFNSTYKIWGNLNKPNSFLKQFYDYGFNCYTINFSNTILTSIVELADEELEQGIDFILSKFQEMKKLVFIAHSLGGVILRYYLDVDLQHQYHKSNDLKRRLNISTIALLASPNHGISVSSSVFRDSKKEMQLKSHDKNIFQEINSETSFREKIKNKFQSNVLSELYYDSKLMYTLNNDVSSNLWPEIPIYNFIASDDIIVNSGSANFHPNEIDYHKNFHQQEFKSVHMKNPFEWRELTNFLNLKELKKIKSNLEERIPGLKYFTLKPIYQNLNVIKYLKEQLNH
jgi:hypothetical protein